MLRYKNANLRHRHSRYNEIVESVANVFHCIGHTALKCFNDIVTITALIAMLSMISLCVIAALSNS